MSQENVELIREIIDSINEGDLDRALAAGHEELEADWSNSVGPHGGGVYKGRERVRELFESFLEAWEEFRWEPEEIIEVGDARVVVVNRIRMRGRGSGVEVDARGAQLWTIDGGKVRSIKIFQSKADALGSLGTRD
jgi:ketosteroid isomerase-like protein